MKGMCPLLQVHFFTGLPFLLYTAIIVLSIKLLTATTVF